MAAFHLHQAAESAYKAFLLVYTNYCPYEHFLTLLDRQAREVLPSLAVVFPRGKQKSPDKPVTFVFVIFHRSVK